MKETELYLGFNHPNQIEMANHITNSMGRGVSSSWINARIAYLNLIHLI